MLPGGSAHISPDADEPEPEPEPEEPVPAPAPIPAPAPAPAPAVVPPEGEPPAAVSHHDYHALCAHICTD